MSPSFISSLNADHVATIMKSAAAVLSSCHPTCSPNQWLCPPAADLPPPHSDEVHHACRNMRPSQDTPRILLVWALPSHAPAPHAQPLQLPCPPLPGAPSPTPWANLSQGTAVLSMAAPCPAWHLQLRTWLPHLHLQAPSKLRAGTGQTFVDQKSLSSPAPMAALTKDTPPPLTLLLLLQLLPYDPLLAVSNMILQGLRPLPLMCRPFWGGPKCQVSQQLPSATRPCPQNALPCSEEPPLSQQPPQTRVLPNPTLHTPAPPGPGRWHHGLPVSQPVPLSGFPPSLAWQRHLSAPEPLRTLCLPYLVPCSP